MNIKCTVIGDLYELLIAIIYVLIISGLRILSKAYNKIMGYIMRKTGMKRLLKGKKLTMLILLIQYVMDMY